MLASRVINQARNITQDNYVGQFRVTDVEFFLWVNEAVRNITSIRTDYRFADTGALLTFVEIVATTDELVVNDNIESCLVSYLCFKFFQQESSDEGNKLKMDHHYKQYIQGLKL